MEDRDSPDESAGPITPSQRKIKGASAPAGKSSILERRVGLDSAASNNSGGGDQNAVNAIRVVENMLVTPLTLPSIFSSLYQSLNLVQNQMNEPNGTATKGATRPSSHKSFFTDSVLVENDVCLSRPRTSTVSRRAQARNVKALKVLKAENSHGQPGDSDGDETPKDKRSRLGSMKSGISNDSFISANASRDNSFHSLSHIAIAKKYARRISSTNSRTVHERLEGLIDELDHLMEDAKDFAQKEQEDRDEDEDLRLMNDMMNNTLMKSPVNGAANSDNQAKTEKSSAPKLPTIIPEGKYTLDIKYNS